MVFNFFLRSSFPSISLAASVKAVIVDGIHGICVHVISPQLDELYKFPLTSQGRTSVLAGMAF